MISQFTKCRVARVALLLALASFAAVVDGVPDGPVRLHGRSRSIGRSNSFQRAEALFDRVSLERVADAHMGSAHPDTPHCAVVSATAAALALPVKASASLPFSLLRSTFERSVVKGRAPPSSLV